MKRFLAFLLIALMLPCCTLAEDEGGEGVIMFPDVESDESYFRDNSLTESEPFIPADVDKTILGQDDRIKVSDPMQYPYRAIAYITGKYECGCHWESTGFMVTKDTLMTAAHCLVCQKHNKWATNLTFYFGYKSNKKYYYKYNSRWTAYVGTLFPNGYTSENDWGYVHFEKKVGEETGWFGMRYPSDSDLEAGRYYVAGYKDGKLMYDIGGVRVMDADRMWINADTLPGNSGGPVFDSENYAVGFFTTYYDDANSGFRLSRKTRDKLVSEGLL